MRKTVMLLIALAILSGCATSNGFKMEDIADLSGGNIERASADKQPSQRVEVVEDDGEGKKTVRLSTDPYSLLGIMKTQALVSGNITVVVGTISDIRFGEYFPGAVGGKCWAVKGDKEFFCQSLLLSAGSDLLFRIAYIIEGLPEEVARAKVMGMSVLGDYLYNGHAKEFAVDKKLKKEGKERRKFIDKNGTLTYDLPRMDDLRESVLAWNPYSTPEGILLSTLGKKEVAYIASINPQYKLLDKLIATGDFSLVPDLTGFSSGLALDVFRAMGAPSTGWNYLSELPSRRDMGIIIEYVTKLRLASMHGLPTNMLATAETRNEMMPVAKREKPTESKPEISKAVVKYAEKISRLGFPAEASLELAKKVKNGKYDDKISVSYSSQTSVLLINGVIKKNQILEWSKNPRYKFFAEVYEADGYVLYHLQSKEQDVWWRT